MYKINDVFLYKETEDIWGMFYIYDIEPKGYALKKMATGPKNYSQWYESYYCDFDALGEEVKSNLSKYIGTIEDYPEYFI